MAGRQKNTRVQLAGDLYYRNQRKCNIRKNIQYNTNYNTILEKKQKARGKVCRTYSGELQLCETAEII